MMLAKQLFSHYQSLCIAMIMVFTCFQFYFGVVPGWTEIRSDFPNYYVSSRLIFEDKDSVNLYDNSWFQESIKSHNIDVKGKFAPFPPPTAFILTPLAIFEPLQAKRIWLMINIALIFLIIRLIKNISGLDKNSSLLLLLCTGVGLANTLMLGQVYLLLLFSMLLAYQLYQKSKSVSIGLLLGSGISIKYFPLVFVPSLIHDRKWKALFSIAFTILTLNFAAAAIFGIQTYVDFFNNVFFQHLDGNLKDQSPWSPAFQSWNALAYNLFQFNAIENPSPWIHSEVLFNCLRYGVVVGVLIFSSLIISKFKRRKDFFEASIIMCSSMILFLSPAGATYHSLLYILPFTLLLKLTGQSQIQSNRHWIVLIACLLLGGILPLAQNKFSIFTDNLLFSFYRLWLNAIIFVLVSSLLIKYQKKPPLGS